jgi:D-alanine-D-alanine ligase-like ATP-grasp enzyme
MEHRLHILAPPLSRDPVSWVHRIEAYLLRRELSAVGWTVSSSVYPHLPGHNVPLLLRLSDNLMRHATRHLLAHGIAFAGPSHDVLEHCYDKYFAYQKVSSAGILIPPTEIGNGPITGVPPFLIKPRRGSDSLGIRIIQSPHIPERFRSETFLIQPFLDGVEITVGFLARPGHPFEILRPPGTIYSFRRKNLMRTPKRPLQDDRLVRRIQKQVLTVCDLMGVDWGARVDFLFERRNNLLYFLECDAAPLIHRASAFTLSLASAGLTREQQITLLLDKAFRNADSEAR